MRSKSLVEIAKDFYKSAMNHQLIRKWSNQTLNDRPYLFDEDEGVIPVEKMTCFASYDKFITDANFPGDNGSHFHIGLIPTPFHGNLRTADIFICLTNPGFNILDYYVEENRDYKELLRRNLKQNLKNDPYPFILLDPKWHWTSGGRWWNSLFRKIIDGLRAKKTISYTEAAGLISKRIAALELIPYHSVDSGHVGSLTRKLPSSRLAQDFVKSEVLPKVAEGEALLVIVSGATMWGIPANLRNVVYPPENKGPKAHLSMKQGGSGQKILEWLLKENH